MEIFLLIIVILLLVIFQSVRNSKLKDMESKLSNIEDYLRKVQLYQAQKADEQKQAVTETVKPVVPVEDKVITPIAVSYTHLCV